VAAARPVDPPTVSRKGRTILLVVVGAALAATGVAVLSFVGARSGDAKPEPAAAPARTFLTGIPQHGLVLGSRRAPVTLVEFADLQCRYCGQFARDALPTVAREYVRTGKVRLVYEGLEFLGVDSDTALRAVHAAARQNHGWDLIDGLFQRQGGENTGWVTDELVRSVAGGIAGLDVARMERDMAAVDSRIQASHRLATTAGVDSTPTFFVGRTGRGLQRVELSSISPDALRPALDDLLAR
jgi:protein-disulfide isomerase